MNTTYFLNLVSGNVFGSKKSPAIPEKYYLGLSSTAPYWLCSCRADIAECAYQWRCDQQLRNRFCGEYR